MAELYAIVGSMERARFMLESGVPYLQLRFKEQPLAPHGEEIARWPREFPRTRVIVNDDLEFALAVGAWGVHLGQQDVRRYYPSMLQHLPLYLGISTHSDAEIERALTYRPAMLGFGPVFATGSKTTAHAPQGVERLGGVVRRVPLPVVAIGGITPHTAGEVAATGVAMVAMIAGLADVTAPDEIAALVQGLRRHRLVGAQNALP